mmetsp:Transcript_160914/g.512023  ORF Transcript_160914/g.512023 Transcript_160914/m.512023 type:complete len:207 (+) Transcript_160914:274-894(+)
MHCFADRNLSGFLAEAPNDENAESKCDEEAHCRQSQPSMPTQLRRQVDVGNQGHHGRDRQTRASECAAGASRVLAAQGHPTDHAHQCGGGHAGQCRGKAIASRHEHGQQGHGREPKILRVEEAAPAGVIAIALRVDAQHGGGGRRVSQQDTNVEHRREKFDVAKRRQTGRHTTAPDGASAGLLQHLGRQFVPGQREVDPALPVEAC